MISLFWALGKNSEVAGHWPGGGRMNLPIRLVTIADNGPEQVHEMASLQRTELQLETLGLTLAEGKTILREIQRVLVQRQVAECLEPYRHCSACGQPPRGKGQHDLR